MEKRHIVLRFIPFILLLLWQPFVCVHSEPEPSWNLVQRQPSDPAMVAAISNAKKRLSLFVDAYKQSRTKEDFFVHTCLRSGEKVEHIWIIVNSIVGNTIKGTLDNQISVVSDKYHSGQVITINFDDVEDWFYRSGNKYIDGWTVIAHCKNSPELKRLGDMYSLPK